MEELLQVTDVELEYFLRVLYERFIEYDVCEYQENWIDYPARQLEEMRKILKLG